MSSSPRSPDDRNTLRSKALWAAAEQLGRIGAWEWSTSGDEFIWSDNTFRLFGYEPGEVEPTAERAFERMHPADVERVRGHHGSARDGQALPPLEYRVVTPDGAVRHLYMTTVAEEREPSDPTRRLVGVVQDVTEQRCAERVAAVERAASRTLATWASFRPGAERLLRELAEALGLDAAAMWLPQGAVLTAAVFWGVSSPEAQARERLVSGLQVPKGVGLAGRAWESRRPLAPAGPGLGEGHAEGRAGDTNGVSPAIALPAVDGDEVLAVLVLYSSEPFMPGERLMEAFAEVGSQLGMFLARRRGVLVQSRLTRRELEVLQLAAQGLASDAIASRLLLSRSTVKTHFEHIYAKLDVSNRVSAVAMALRAGLIE